MRMEFGTTITFEETNGEPERLCSQWNKKPLTAFIYQLVEVKEGIPIVRQ